MSKIKKICVMTGSRAEYGLLRPLLNEIKSDHSLKLQIIATGMHLSWEFGLTYKEIERDGFKIDEKVEMLLSSDTSVGISKSMGLALISFSEIYQRLKPDMIMVLGDRFEIFSAVTAALINRIPVAHISGGDVTEGVFDDAMRHSMTKMSHLHFVTTETYRKRVIQLGELPNQVFNVGSLAIDNIKNIKFLSKKHLEKQLDFKFHKNNLLVTFHPVTLEGDVSKKHFNNLLKVLDQLKNTGIIFTKANADPQGRVINSMIDDYVAHHQNHARAFNSMGWLKYLSALRFVDAVVGNSSSGIIEVPSFNIGTINIGDRQKGRVKAKSVIDCKPDRASIEKAFKTLFSTSFKKQVKRVINIYGEGQAAKRIVKIIKKYKLETLLKKEFYDVI